MKTRHRTILSTAPFLAATLAAGAAWSDMLTANCTGMLDVNVYKIDLALGTQVVDGIGDAVVTVSEDAILLDGAFGQYRFDRKVGTLYHDEKDTGLYCTYAVLSQD